MRLFRGNAQRRLLVGLVIALHAGMIAIAVAIAADRKLQSRITGPELEWLVCALVGGLGSQSILLGVWAGIGQRPVWLRVLLSWVVATIPLTTWICLVGDGMGNDFFTMTVLIVAASWTSAFLLAWILRIVPWTAWRLGTRNLQGPPKTSLIDLLVLQACVLVALVLLGSMSPGDLGSLESFERDLPIAGVLIGAAVLLTMCLTWIILSSWRWPPYLAAPLLLALGVAVWSAYRWGWDFKPVFAMLTWSCGWVTLTWFLIRFAGYRFIGRSGSSDHVTTSDNENARKQPFLPLVPATFVALAGFFCVISWLGFPARQQVFYQATVARDSDEYIVAIHAYELKDADILRHMRRFPRLRELVVNGRIADDDLRVLTVCRNLRNLQIDGTYLDGTGLAALADLPKLDHLAIRYSCLNEAGWQAVSQIRQLQELDVTETELPPQAFKHLQNHRSLASVKLGGSNLNDEHLQLLATIPALESVGISETAVTLEGIIRFLESRQEHGDQLPSLECHGVWLVRSRPDGLRLELSDSANLQAFEGLEPSIAHIQLEGAITERTGRSLALFSKLKVLALHDGTISDEAADVLSRMPLKILEMQDMSFSQQGIRRIQEIKTLDMLIADNTSLPFDVVVRMAIRWQEDPEREIRYVREERRLVTHSLHLHDGKGRLALHTSDADLQLCAELNVHELHVSGPGFTNAALLTIRDMKSLEGIVLEWTKMTGEKVEELYESRPDLKRKGVFFK